MRRRPVGRGVGIALLIVWQFAVFAAFYWVQKPFRLTTAQMLARIGLDGAAALAMVVLASGLGRRILIWMGLSDLPPGDLVWLSPALGLGSLGLIGLGLSRRRSR